MRVRTGWSHVLLALAVSLQACAGGSLETIQPVAVSDPASPASSPVRGRRVPVPESFQQALEAGTRTEEGVPGPEYWTQRVDYTIEVELDPETAVLDGSETIVYQNRSPDALGVLILHLYQNLFSPGVPRTRNVPVTGGMTIQRIAFGGEEREEVQTPTRGGYLIDGTLMAVYPDEPIPPGGRMELEVAWEFEVPPEGAPRQGHIDHRLYNVAQWYPQVAVYDDLEGWDVWPYLANGEFYLEYGNFDVAVTVPEGWLVGASGTLQNAEAVLPGQIRDRLSAAMTGDEVVHVVTEADFGAGSATLSSPDGQLTWRFLAEDVRDFAFATSAEYLWDASRVSTPDASEDGVAEVVAVHAFYRPEAESWTDAASYIRHAVGFHAERWHPYPWPQMTGAEGPVGGMEYPMLTFVADFGDPRAVYETLNHEIGHMWYPMMLGSNEASFPWMDEGLTTYVEGYATADFFDEPGYWRNDQTAYLSVAGSDRETPIMRHADLHGPYGTYGQAAYWKPATLLRALEGVIGRETVWAALQAYSEAWLYRHPAPHDFFNVVERLAGMDLDWFWIPWWYETAVMDQAIIEVAVGDRPDGGRVAEVSVADLGGAPMPVYLLLDLSNGDSVEERVGVEVWLTGTAEQTLSVPLPPGTEPTRVEIDPEMLFPDVNPENNVWEP